MPIFDLPFLVDFLANAVATIIGLIVGIPIALWINRRQQQSVQEIEDLRIRGESLSRKTKILQLVRAELRFNRGILASYWKERQEYSKPYFDYGYQLKYEVWRAFSDGGELEWIKDLDILQSMAIAYYSIKRVMETGATYVSYDLQLDLRYNYPVDRPHDSRYQLNRLHAHLDASIEFAISSVDEALQMIDPQLGSSPPAAASIES